jgi:hypothetical protein
VSGVGIGSHEKGKAGDEVAASLSPFLQKQRMRMRMKVRKEKQTGSVEEDEDDDEEEEVGAFFGALFAFQSLFVATEAEEAEEEEDGIVLIPNRLSLASFSNLSLSFFSCSA